MRWPLWATACLALAVICLPPLLALGAREPGDEVSPPPSPSFPVRAPTTALVARPPAWPSLPIPRAAAMATPTPAPPRYEPPAVRAVERGWLTREEFMALVALAGWPAELHEAAYRVACGSPPRWPHGESGCHPGSVGDGGNSLGLFQLNAATWAPYCGTAAEALLDALTNARCAWAVYQYDIERGHAPWTQWSVKP